MKQKYKYTVREVLLKMLGHHYITKEDGIYINMLQEKVEVKWCPKIEEHYYCVFGNGEIHTKNYYDDSYDKWRLKTSNCFPYTEEGKKQCEEYKQKLISLGGTK